MAAQSFIKSNYYDDKLFLNQARAWFLEIVFVKTSVCVCVCVCVCPPPGY